jgi:hypothetical protein
MHHISILDILRVKIHPPVYSLRQVFVNRAFEKGVNFTSLMQK